jgi:uroporphyrinogen-III synthase
MNLPIIAVRPEPGCSATVAAGRGLGLRIAGWPLFAVGPRAWDPPRPETIDALLLGSANAIRHGGDGLAALADKPVYAVGEVTARAAEGAGFAIGMVGGGGLQELLDRMPPSSTRFLRLAGEEHVPVQPPPGVTIETRIVYASEALPLPRETADTLSDGAVVLLHSAAAARHFAAECDRLGIERGKVCLAALGRRIAAAAGPGWRTVAAVAEPAEPGLLALAGKLCHDPADKETRYWPAEDD